MMCVETVLDNLEKFKSIAYAKNQHIFTYLYRCLLIVYCLSVSVFYQRENIEEMYQNINIHCKTIQFFV